MSYVLDMSDGFLPDQESDLGRPGEKLILIVDDDDGQAELMEHIVQKEGFRSERAARGDEALKKVEEQKPDLILLDLLLPDKGGYELLHEFQAAGAGSIPVLVLTGKTLNQKTIELIKSEPNVRDLISKPPRPATLGMMLHSLLKTSPLKLGAS